MTARFEQTGTEVCSVCGMPRELAIAAAYDTCMTEGDFAIDGYPEPGELHEWVRVTPPAAPLILPMGVQLAEERAREMAVIAEYEENERQIIDGVEYIVCDFDLRAAEEQSRAIREGTFR